MTTLLLVMLSLLISYATRNSALSLKDILFWVGAAPIAIFSIFIFGILSGRGARVMKSIEDTSGQPVELRPPMKRCAASDQTSSGLAWVLAGLLVWLFSYVI